MKEMVIKRPPITLLSRFLKMLHDASPCFKMLGLVAFGLRVRLLVDPFSVTIPRPLPVCPAVYPAPFWASFRLPKSMPASGVHEVN